METARDPEKKWPAAETSRPGMDDEGVETSPGTLMLSNGLYCSPMIECPPIRNEADFGVREAQEDGQRTVALYPIPSSDPNDPLNWSKLRKGVNFGLGCCFVFFTFALINVIYIPYVQLVADLDFTFNTFTTSVALAFTGLATSSVLFLPLLHKFGRRWLYLLGSALQLAAAIWLSQMTSKGDLMGAYFFSGMGGGLSETLLQVTIVDLFFVHQRGTMSGLFLLANTAGSGLGPLAGGYIVTGQGWRWMWRWCGIFLAVNLLLVVFFFEETKYIPLLNSQPIRDEVQAVPSQQQQECLNREEGHQATTAVQNNNLSRPAIDPSVKRKSTRQRLALFTNTKAPVLQHLYQPFHVLFTFPAITYTAVTYGALTTWFTVLVSVVESSIVYPPYNFSPSGVGLLILSVVIGCALGSLLGGPMNDKSAIWISARNGGVYEPEYRLYMALVASVPAIAGILMTGLGLAHQKPWPLLAVGFGIFGFSWTVIGECALAYVSDCYQDIIGDALVAVVFVRNALAIAVLFGLSHWLAAVGLQNLIISIAVIALFFFLLPVPLLLWGKKARVMTAKKYRDMASRLPGHR
ncbi:hypothetical protein LTR84_010635 [Exophiala bonariae]|uniref:Major facilitator superfamily (MFS) profile domain-containing protein n=1 Tax=Exophiala bonariae TaxID=1690606 RepID=A0AAV9MVJ6_9EURO|nr:hypothetical protein LTR84_010635 [Exophiala bonariae]